MIRKFPEISYFTDFRQTRSAKKIPKTVLKEPTYTLVFVNTLWSLPKPLNPVIFSVFGRFLEDYLRNLTWWKKYKTDSDS
jgi:hypothetical protein